MGENEAEATDTLEAGTTEELETGVETEEVEAAEDGETGEAAEEFEIVRESGESQPQPATRKNGFQKRVNKLRAKVDAANQSAESSSAEVAILQERLKIQEIALEQARGSQSQELKAPNPDDYDAGEYDPDFIKKKEAYTDARIAKQVADQVAAATKQTAQTHSNTARSDDLQEKQRNHYDRAEKLGAKDYAATEDVAIEKLGVDNVNYIVGKFNDSQNILYYLGKNPAEAEALRDLAAKDSDLALVEIGRLRSEIKVRPKKSTNAPDPDEESEGAIPSSKKGKRGPPGASFK